VVAFAPHAGIDDIAGIEGGSRWVVDRRGGAAANPSLAKTIRAL